MPSYMGRLKPRLGISMEPMAPSAAGAGGAGAAVVTDIVGPLGLGVGMEGYAKPSLKKCRPIAARNEDEKVFSGRL